MQEGSKLLLSLIDSGKSGFTELMDYQLNEEMFKGSEEELYIFVRDHILSYGKLPERKTVAEWADENQTAIPASDTLVEPAQFYYDKMQHRNTKLALKKALQEAADKVNEDTPYEALSELTHSVMDMTNVRRATKLINFSQAGSKIIRTETAKVHHPDTEYGLKFGWPTFDNMSGGLVGGDVISIVGRPAMGKTYMMLYGAIKAWKDGRVPLFISMEMKTIPIVQRITALITKTSITEIKTGSVGGKKYHNLLTQLSNMKTKQDFWIADGALSSTVDDLLLLCQQLQPDVLYIDGAYLLQHGNLRLPRWERVSTNAEAIKSNIAEGLNIPVVVSYQLNRETTKKKSKDVGVENIAYSDSIGQLSSVVLGLFEEENVETMLRRKVRILKGRNGESGEFTINWRFGGMGKYLDKYGKMMSWNPKEGEEQDPAKAEIALSLDTSDVMNFDEFVDEYTELNKSFL